MASNLGVYVTLRSLFTLRVSRSFPNLHEEITKFMASVVIYESSQVADRDVVSV